LASHGIARAVSAERTRLGPYPRAVAQLYAEPRDLASDAIRVTTQADGGDAGQEVGQLELAGTCDCTVGKVATKTAPSSAPVTVFDAADAQRQQE